MDIRYGFYLDTRSCTGCKACQIACKDKNNLPVGILWRRVVEVNGGNWSFNKKLWTNNVYAYFVSTACMHCHEPICVEVCPTGAIYQRGDGIVLIDGDLCIGCRYCEMACPYKAPQYDVNQKIMTKCDFCIDLLEIGQSPACVSACQMRVLQFGNLTDLQNEHGDFIPVFPLPNPDLTKPAIVVYPHQESIQFDTEGAKISNLEDI